MGASTKRSSPKANWELLDGIFHRLHQVDFDLRSTLQALLQAALEVSAATAATLLLPDKTQQMQPLFSCPPEQTAPFVPPQNLSRMLKRVAAAPGSYTVVKVGQDLGCALWRPGLDGESPWHLSGLLYLLQAGHLTRTGSTLAQLLQLLAHQATSALIIYHLREHLLPGEFLAPDVLTKHLTRHEQARQPQKSRRESLRYSYPQIIGESPAIYKVLEILDKIADADVPVLIQGESGTGKELVARAIHRNSRRRQQPFVSENCAAITETLLESELFGYVKGAFTGAHQNKMGLFEIADGGTLFLDEVGDMSLGMQKKLLRALQEGEIRPVGGKHVKKVDVRILAATNKDLKQAMAQGEFREDLYYRLNVLNLELPPLRERGTDILILAEYFLEKIAREMQLGPKQMSAPVREAFLQYSWPGNIREMENEIKRMVALGDNIITPDVLSPAIQEVLHSSDV